MFEALKIAHEMGATALGVGLVFVWFWDWRGRRAGHLEALARCARRVALCYDGVVVPGALTMVATGGWMLAEFWGWAFLELPWLAAMVILFALEFVEGNTITRLYFRRFQRATAQALLDASAARLKTEPLASFTHFLDLPAFSLIVLLGVFRPEDGLAVGLGVTAALALAVAQTWLFPPFANRAALIPKVIDFDSSKSMTVTAQARRRVRRRGYHRSFSRLDGISCAEESTARGDLGR